MYVSLLPNDGALAPDEQPAVEPSRRAFLAGTGALVVAVTLPGSVYAAPDDPTMAPPAEGASDFSPFVRVDPDGTVTVQSPAQEMGQGSNTGLMQLVADELDADWDKVRIVHAPEAKAYRFAMIPGDARQMTGGSMSIRQWRKPMREAGAKARAMLIAAAAEVWGARPTDLTTDTHKVVHPDGRTLDYGALVGVASTLKPPRKVALKPRDQWKYMGKGMPREDLRAKVTGAAQYGMDVRLPGMVRACVVPCPIDTGRVKAVDDSAARAVPGVLDVVVIDNAVAVIAKTFWPAKKGADALKVTWDDAGHGDVGSATIARIHAEALDDEKGVIKGWKQGKAARVIEDAETVLEATYTVPYLDHATIEPLVCTVHVQDDRCDVWVGSQAPTLVLRAAMDITGFKEDQVAVYTKTIGGAFGRKGNNDWVEMSLHIGMQVDAPVQCIWTREATTRMGRYRPAITTRMRAVVEGKELKALHVRQTGDNSGRSWMSPFFQKLNLYHWFNAEGHIKLGAPYQYENVLVEVVPRTFHPNVGFWRSVGQSFTIYKRECFLDEIAEAMGEDPITLRRRMLRDDPRLRHVLDLCIEKSGWGKAPEGHFQGFGLTDWAGTMCAQVVEVRLDSGVPRIVKVTATLDCGAYVNADQVKAQVQGGCIMGLSSALGEQITFDKGRTVQSNFHDYKVMRMNKAPYNIDVHLVDAFEHEPRGVGEPGTPPGIPALVNAIYAATGTRVRSLPLPPELGGVG